MTRTEHIRYGIIEKLIIISNKDYLKALYQPVNNSPITDDFVKINEKQIIMLKPSEKDIKEGKTISQAQVDKADHKWLKEI